MRIRNSKKQTSLFKEERIYGKESVMKYRLIAIGAVVLVIAIAAIVIMSQSGSSFSTQRLTIQGKVQEVHASQQVLPGTFRLTVPAVDDGKPWNYANPSNCACFELDSSTSLPLRSLMCVHGQQAPLGLSISASCTITNSMFYLER